MTRENAKKLQSMMAKEAVTLLMLGGAEADTAEHEEAIRLIGEAWGLAEEETARQIERIGHGRQSVRMGAENMPPDEGDVVMERDKFYFNDSYKYAYFDDISGIVTDEFPDDTIVSTLERAGVKLF